MRMRYVRFLIGVVSMSDRAVVAVVTDSVGCLPPELVERYSIRTIPLNVIMEGQVYRDGVDLSPKDVYEALKRGTQLPSTSAPSPGEVAEVFREVGERAGSILCITLSSKLSMMFSAVQQARESARETMPQTEITVLDSGTAAGAEGFVVQVAVEAAASGKSLNEVTARAQQISAKVNLIATIDTLRYLARGGRIGRATSWASSLLNIKPIIHVVDGDVIPLERPRTRARALGRLVKIMQDRVGGRRVHVNLQHAAAPEEAEALKDDITSRFDCVETYVTDFTPVMGAHTGPGTIALAFYAED